MKPLRHVIHIISDILSFNEDREQLLLDLSHPEINWELFVKVCSHHLVLPALYCRLKQKELLKYLPNELAIYLKEITNINRNRNKTIIKEANEISNLFKDNNIDHIFLKGTALLLNEYYEDIAERMIGDIDILLTSEQAKLAYELLISKNYDPPNLTFGYKYIEHKHLPRLIPQTNLASVELHTSLLKNKSESKVLTEKILEDLKSKKTTPSHKNLMSHTIQNFLINDNGLAYNTLNLRTLYDCLIINKKERVTPSEKNESVYLLKQSCLVTDFNSNPENLKERWIVYTYNLIIKRKSLTKIKIYSSNLLIFISTLFKRLLLAIVNKSYRKDLFNDRKRVLKLIKIKYFKNL